MAENPTLHGQPRSILGKQVKHLRRAGQLPGIVYGPVVSPARPVTVDAHEFDEVYRRTGATALVDLTVDGETHVVFIREVDREPVKKAPLNINFYAPALNRPIDANVPVVAVGELPGTVDGILTHHRAEVLVRALPRDLPQQIEVDLSALSDVDRAIMVADLAMPAGVELLTPGDDIIVSLETPAAVEEPVLPEAQDVLAEETGDRPAEMRPDTGPIEEPR
ncbi:MAG TPA: 50S ribosomal protein L25 [Thermomicrobiaceae bacterium]|nr:50S ribosomal protein L25 [Thermomicrobiaceae bacterium]